MVAPNGGGEGRRSIPVQCSNGSRSYTCVAQLLEGGIPRWIHSAAWGRGHPHNAPGELPRASKLDSSGLEHIAA